MKNIFTLRARTENTNNMVPITRHAENRLVSRDLNKNEIVAVSHCGIELKNPGREYAKKKVLAKKDSSYLAACIERYQLKVELLKLKLLKLKLPSKRSCAITNEDRHLIKQKISVLNVIIDGLQQIKRRFNQSKSKGMSITVIQDRTTNAVITSYC